jgi:hypothetical protein
LVFNNISFLNTTNKELSQAFDMINSFWQEVIPTDVLHWFFYKVSLELYPSI